MQNFIKSDLGTVGQRIRKPVITACLFFTAVVLNVIFNRGHVGYFLTNELLGSIGTSFMVGGLWYGKGVVARVAEAPIDEDTGEELHPGGFNGTAFRIAIAIAAGATVGAVYFAVDTIRLLFGMVNRARG